MQRELIRSKHSNLLLFCHLPCRKKPPPISGSQTVDASFKRWVKPAMRNSLNLRVNECFAGNYTYRRLIITPAPASISQPTHFLQTLHWREKLHRRAVYTWVYTYKGWWISMIHTYLPTYLLYIYLIFISSHVWAFFHKQFSGVCVLTDVLQHKHTASD